MAGKKQEQDKDVVAYSAATKEQQEALFKKYGRDAVKAVPGFRNMPLGKLAATCAGSKLAAEPDKA